MRLDLFADQNAGKLLRDEGMAATLQAEREEIKQGIVAFANVYATQNPLFKIEDMRAAYIAQGGTEPHASKVWGAITNKLIRARVMAYEKHVASVSPKTHGHRVPLYRSLRWKINNEIENLK
jgi:hypothetical protein